MQPDTIDLSPNGPPTCAVTYAVKQAMGMMPVDLLYLVRELVDVSVAMM